MSEFPFLAGPGPALQRVFAINNSAASQSVAETADPIVPDWVITGPVAEPTKFDRAQAEQFAHLLFDGMTGYVNLRAIEEPAPEGRKARVVERWAPIDANLPGAVGNYVEECAANGLAAYLLPHPVSEGGGGLKDIQAQRVIPIDIDHGDISAKVKAITAALGEPWLSLQSGGVVNGQPKAHLYYRLAADLEPDQFERIAELRDAIAHRFGADLKVGRNPAQILRVPGSVHAKAERRMCALDTVNASCAVTLDQLAGALGVSASPASNVVPFSLDFSRDRPVANMDRVLLEPILAEGASGDGLTRFEGAGSAVGHFIRLVRDGRYSEAEGWAAAKDWNQAVMVPPWSEERLLGDWERLKRIDVERNGPMAAALSTAQGSVFKLSDWTMQEYAGQAPVQRWLVNQVFPLGDAGILAGDGGIGKSFLALDLCFRVAGAKMPIDPLDFGRSEIFGGEICEAGSAVFVTAEESKAALHRRLEAIDPHRQRAKLKDRLFVVSLRSEGGGQSLIGSKNKNYPMTEYARLLLAELKTKPDLRLCVLDPLSVFYGAEGNDRTAVQAFANVLNHIASETGATIIALHHMRKDTEGGSSRKNILGSGGFVDAFRFSYTLQKSPARANAKYAADYALPSDHGELVIGELVKANGSSEGGEHLYERHPSGILRQAPRRVDIAKAEHDRRRGLLVEAVDWYAAYGQPFTKTSRAGGPGLYQNRHALPEALRALSTRQLETLVEEAVEIGELQPAACGKEKRQQWLCKPGSDAAQGLLRDFTPGARPAWEAR